MIKTQHGYSWNCSKTKQNSFRWDYAGLDVGPHNRYPYRHFDFSFTL